ncbi:MAG: 30S ribosome-binding factor RbfA [Pseudomonadota bacterium]|jgi:ribosome-binding factor A
MARRDNPRAVRIAEQIQRELPGLIRLELDDPDVGMVTLTGVEVAADLAHAKVFFTVLEAPDARVDAVASRRRQSTQALARAAGYLRSELGSRLRLRSVPQLHFFYDESIERGAHLSRLIDRAVSDDEGRG